MVTVTQQADGQWLVLDDKWGPEVDVAGTYTEIADALAMACLVASETDAPVQIPGADTLPATAALSRVLRDLRQLRAYHEEA